MCLCAVTIRNPKIKAGTFLVSVDKEYINVPCGHCSECINAKRRDLTFRAYYEYLNCVSNGGFSMFDTLTFNELSVPRFGYFTFFNNKLVQDFIKRLKSKLEYDGYDIKGKFKYLIVPEYGEKTYRVHYHPLWFSCIKDLSPFDFAKYVRAAWKNVDLDKSTGFTDYRPADQRVINSVHGIMYVLKYLTKHSVVLDALKYHGGSDVSQYILNSLTDEEKENYSCVRQAWLSYKYTNNVPKDFDLFPKPLMSHGLGLSFLENASLDDLFNEVFIPCKSKEKQQDMFTVPSYFIRKVFYKYDKNSKLYRPNELYKVLDTNRVNHSMENLKDNIRTLDEIWYAISLKDKEKLSKKYGLQSLGVPSHFIKSLLNGRDLSHFIKYVVFFRNIHYSPYQAWLYEGYLDKLDDGFVDLYANYRYDALLSDSLPFRVFDEKVKHTEVQTAYRSISTTFFNDLSYFKDYDKLYDFVQSVMQYYKNAKQLQYAELEKQQKYEKLYKQQFMDCIVN